jgi:hypothetical protein
LQSAAWPAWAPKKLIVPPLQAAAAALFSAEDALQAGAVQLHVRLAADRSCAR